MRQRKRNTVTQNFRGQLLFHIKNQGAVAFVGERFAITLLEQINQSRLAMKIHRVFFGIIAQAINTNGAAAFGFGREEAGLAPFERLFNPAHASCLSRRIQHKLAQRFEPRSHLWPIGRDGFRKFAHTSNPGK
jgi:hypothetical protein